MSANNSMNSSGSSSLRPAWYRGAGNQGGRGFQPPPTVTSERADRMGRASSAGAETKRDINKFSALQDDDDVITAGGIGNNGKNNDQQDQPKHVATNSRSEAFRTSFGRGGNPAKTGRSLADLAARVPESSSRNSSSGYGASRFSSLRSSNDGIPSTGVSSGSNVDPYKSDAKVIRYTREKLLSKRPQPRHDLPSHLKHVEGTVILSKTAQDPVCWDTFDAEEIWSVVLRDRRGIQLPKVSGIRGIEASESVGVGVRRGIAAPSSGRWKRGVALPPPDENLNSKRGKERDASNPNDLWDDPVGGVTGAAMDFSAFGIIPDDPKINDFDLEQKQDDPNEVEDEFQEEKGVEDVLEEDGENSSPHMIKVNPRRPLATVGTTIKSGSGDDVNVFEDFDTPSEGEAPPDVSSLKLNDGPTASSRLMKMIGVGQDEPESNDTVLNTDEPPKDISEGILSWGLSVPEHESSTLASVSDSAAEGIVGTIGSSAPGASSIPLNPWGDPIIPQNQTVGTGMDIAARLEAFAAEQKSREAAELEQKELLRRKQEQEEAQRRAIAQQQQQQAQDRARQAQVAAMQHQAPSAQSQVELVLMERISAILENSWGRSDLLSILTSLHAEDSRVIPLLGNVDLLRDLIAHNPRRVSLRHDPAFGAEMAVLLMTNAQWQQQQQQEQEAQARAQQEELRRLEQQRRLEDMQQQAAAAAVQEENLPTVIPDAPWYYSDPQNNIQGPFRGEEMRQWLEAGYFKGDLPISQQPSGPFLALSQIFPDLSIAFRIVEDNSAEEEAAAAAEAKALAIAEEEQLYAQQQQWEQEQIAAEQAKAEAEAREAVEQRRLEQEAASKANAANESSAQLKMMLGLSSENKMGGAKQPTEEIKAVEKPVEKRVSKTTKNTQVRPTRDSDAGRVNQSTEVHPKPTASAWGGASKIVATKKSMSEIQKEEARAAAIMAMQRESMPRPSNNGWANIAASGGGSSGWTSGTVKPVTAVANNMNISGNARMGQAPSKQQSSQISSIGRKAVDPQQQGRVRSSSSNAADEFGASMSPMLEKWCKDQMQMLKSTDDLTLVSFCMTLNDPSEIRQYLTTYLGATQQVENFASEFINRIGGATAKQEEWETPGSAKKGRKKKGSR